jgi:hypothetical protein
VEVEHRQWRGGMSGFGTLPPCCQRHRCPLSFFFSMY